MPASSKGEIVLEYLRKYPSCSSKELARLIKFEIPLYEGDEENIRAMIRYYRGANGDSNRKKLSIDKYCPKIIIPDSSEFDYSPILIKDDEYPILVGADAHFPYHSQDSIEAFFDYGEYIKPKTIVLLGDWLDMYSISKFIKDPRCVDVKGEISMLKEVLKQVRKTFPKARIIYKFGNHEERWDNFVMTHAPEIFKMDCTHLSEILKMDNPSDKTEVGFNKLDIEIVEDKKLIKAKHLYIIHGHEYTFSIQNPVNPARGLYLRAKKSALCAHFHQSSEHSEQSISGEMTTAWSIGCLCNLKARYSPLNKWNNGFAKIDLEDEHFKVENKRIINGRIL